MIYCSGSCTGYELTADIDLAGIEWQPIGSPNEPFSGVFKGNGYTISNLTIKANNTDNIGLFAAIGAGGRVENLGLVNVDIAGQGRRIGSIAAFNSGTIINSYADGRLVDSGGSINVVGGLVGRNERGEIVNSYAHVNIEAATGFAGGLVGENRGGSIVNGYAGGDVRVDSGIAGGLVGTNGSGGSIVNSYAGGDVQVGSGRAGGLVAASSGRQTLNNSYYRKGAVISGTDSLVGIDKTAVELKAGVPSDDVYTGWDKTDWHFGNAEQYPVLLYVAGDDNDHRACATSPTDTELPTCETLLPGQRAGLAQMELSKNARLLPTFNPEIHDYNLVVHSGTTFRTTPTAYYDTDTITVDAAGLRSSTTGGQSLLFTLNDDLNGIVITVRSASHNVPTRYTIKVLHSIAVVDGLITIDYLEDLNLMRNPIEQVSDILEDCPIDTEDTMRRCRGYKLSRDLNFKDPTSYRSGRVNLMWTTGAGWQPIGDHSNPFGSLFDGNTHTISNLRIDAIAVDNIGLFGVSADAARIENIGLVAVDIDVNGQSNIGALVGENRGDIVNSYVIDGDVRGNSYVGGLVGRNSGVIVNSYTNVAVAGTTNFVGGLAGSSQSGSRIDNSYASGTATGNDFVGGLVGLSQISILNSYANVAVIGSRSVGGLVGGASNSIINSYAIGKISGGSEGLIGSVRINFFAIDSYWDVATSTVGDDNNDLNGVGKTTSQLRTPAIGEGIYLNWGSDDWYSESGRYPLLRYTGATDIIVRPACRVAENVDSELPVCGTLLPNQRIGLRNLARSNSVGQVLLLRPDFNSGIYDYELILKSDAREFSIIPYTFNPNAVIVVDDDSEINPQEKLRSSQVTTLQMDNINSFLLTLTVDDPLVSGATQTTVYRFEVIRHPLITVNDIDEDDDGLIEIHSVDDLNAIRYQPDGSGYKASRNDTKITVGCPETGCIGYELVQDLDVDDAMRFADWQPIGYIAPSGDADECNHPSNRCFSGIFDGNNHTISNLRIDKSDTDNVGLFAALADGAQVKNVNLANVSVEGRFGVGSLVAYNAGEIDNSYADGTITGERDVGGLVAYNVGRISDSYAYGAVSGGSSVGGLVARNKNGGAIANSYSLNRVSGDDNIGGLVGLNLGFIVNTHASGVVEGSMRIGGLVANNGGSVADSYATADILCTGVPMCTSYTVATGGLIGSDVGGVVANSYWDTGVSKLRVSAGGVGKTTLQLQSGSGQSSDASGAYYRWRDSDWYFGTVDQYPILKYADSTESTLVGLQSYGLTSLTIAEIVTLSPNFDTTKLYYRVGVELDTDIRKLHLTPNALDEDATIRIFSDNGFDETVASGTDSSAIVLRSTGTTVINIEVSGSRRVLYRFEVDYFSSGFEDDVDTDKDGLIDILSLEDLDAIRNALDGRRLRYQNADGVSIESAKGCPISGCKGYELMRDLDFDNPTHYRTGRVNTAWTGGAGWQPIGTSLYPFTATFKGNGYTISNLRVNRADNDGGLFGVIDGSESDVVIEGLGLIDVDIVGGTHVGGLVGTNRAGDIRRSYVTGYVVARGDGTSAIVGGLVGRNVAGSITESYSETQVKGNLSAGLSVALAGGLVALNDGRGRIENSCTAGSVIGSVGVGGMVGENNGSVHNSYAVSRVIGIGALSTVGGLVAVNDAVVDDSYWDIEVSGIASSAGGTSATTAVLRSSTPTSPINSIYKDWDTDVWEFADTNRYPELKAIADVPLLAPEGKSLLQSLTLSDNVRLFPSFHPLVFDYELIAEADRMTEVRLDTTSTRIGTTIDITCRNGLICSPGIPTSFALDGSDTPKITITTHNLDAGELSYSFSVRYHELKIERMTATTTTIVPLSLSVAEGERVRLMVSYHFSLDEDLYRYRWRQSSGDVLKFNDKQSPVDMQNAMLNFMIPDDVVSKQDDSRVVRLIAEVNANDDIYLSKMLSLIISKRNNDTADRIHLLGDSDQPDTYAVRFERDDGSEFVDRDGGFAETRIHWQRRRSDTEDWVDVGNGSPYTIPDEGAYQYRALATYEDNQGYREQFESGVINYLDLDDDGDGLIEIRYLEELDAIRHQPDGSGYKATASADKITAGCPLVNGIEQCRGYELMNDLDFNDDQSYRTLDPSRLKNSWTVSDFSAASDSGWQPIGGFNAVFDGNGYTISNIQINRSVGNTSNIGLFSDMGSGGKVKNLGLIDPAIKGLVGIKNVGGIAGRIERGGVIMNSHVIGDVGAGKTDKIIRGGSGLIGGMVGRNKGLILNSYAKINVIAEDSGTIENRVGGLVGRNIDGGKVYNSYATGEVKGPCIVGGLVGNQFSTNSNQLLTRSEIKNSYATGNVETGFGTCSNSNNKVAAALVGVNTNSKVENSYTLGKVSGSGTLSNLIARGSAPINSYWDSGTTNVGGDASDRTTVKMISTLGPGTAETDIYYRWSTDDWDFGTIKQYPALKYGVGLDKDDPGCDTDPETALPSCDSLLHGQIADMLLLDSLSVSANSRAVRLTPNFMPSRFNYEAVIDAETAPVFIRIVAAADANSEITFRRDGGAPLTKQSDGTVQISESHPFNLGIEIASGNERAANYKIQVHLSYLPQPRILKVINTGISTELVKGNILSLNEGDVVRLDASESFGQNDSRLDYRWSQVSGKPLLPGIQTTSTVKFTVPTDFVAADDDDSTVILKLKLSENNNPLITVSEKVALLVRKINNGNAESDAKWISSDTLSASDLLDDIDGGPLIDVVYLWSLEQNGKFIAIPGATRKSYTPPENARYARYRVSISYTDGQGYRTNTHHDAPRFTTIADFVDKDNDGLIEIETLDALDAIRYQPDGSGYRANAMASKITTGCPLVNGVEKCRGYELVGDLDFLGDAGYSSTANKVAWTSGAGWQPIGDPIKPFTGIFDGNGFTIANLTIDRADSDYIGLFGVVTGANARIKSVGLIDVSVVGNEYVGGLIGFMERGKVAGSYVKGTVAGSSLNIGGLVGSVISSLAIEHSYTMANVMAKRADNVGGLVGFCQGDIRNSYAASNVTASGFIFGNIGGLVGLGTGNIDNGYTFGDVTVTASIRVQSVGGLVGFHAGNIRNSYAASNVTVSGFIVGNTGGLVGGGSTNPMRSYWKMDADNPIGSANSIATNLNYKGFTSDNLKAPVAAGTIDGDAYYDWNTDQWDFGTFEEYPVLKYHDNSCATATPSPDCGKLLLHQRIGLRDIKLEQNVEGAQLYLSPDFDSAVKTYTVSVHADASELRVTPIAANPDAGIVADGKVLSAKHSGYTIAIDTSEPTSTVIVVAASNSMGTEDAIAYKLTVNNRLPTIDINAPTSISEGETLRLNASITDADRDELHYNLSVITDLLPDLEEITGNVVGDADFVYALNIPSNLLGERQSTDNLEIVLTVEDGMSVIGETVRLRVIKENNGVMSVPIPTLRDDTYTLDDIDLSSDADGINPAPEIVYRWQKELFGNWSDIDGATHRSYTTEGIIGDRYRILVDYIDKQGYRHRSVASPSISAPQQFVYDALKSRSAVRDLVGQQPGIFIHVRVFPEGLLR